MYENMIMPEWMKELYIAVLRFKVPIKYLRFCRRQTKNSPWSVYTTANGFTNIEQFVDALQNEKK